MRIAVFAAIASLVGIADAAILHNVSGYAWDHEGGYLGSIEQARAVAGDGPADARFRVTEFSYPGRRQRTVRSTNLLSDLIGIDAGTMIGRDFVLETSVIVFRGQIELAPSIERFAVASDDGFALSIGGTEVGRHDGLRSYAATAVEGDFGLGLKSFELIYFENRGRAGVSFLDNGAVAQVQQTPVPGALGFMLTGLAALGLDRARRHAAG